MPIVERNGPIVTSPVEWNNTWSAIQDGGTYTFANGETESFDMYGHAFGDIPTTVSIIGIGVRVDALKNEAAGSGSLRIGIKLSWDGGTSWTTEKETALLSTTEATFYLGGASDTWGRSWTRSEIVSNFRVRVTTAADGAVLDFPEWRVDWVQVAVYYSETETLTLDLASHAATNDAIDETAWSIDVLNLISTIAPTTSSAFGAVIEFGGDVVTEQQTSPTFATAAEESGRIEAFGVEISWTSPDLTTPQNYKIANIDTATAMSGAAKGFVSGAIALHDINWEGVFGSASPRATATFSISRDAFVNQIPIPGPLRRFEEMMAIGVNPTVIIYAFIKDEANIWHQRVLFRGSITDPEVGEDDVRMTALLEGAEWNKVPKYVLDETAMAYTDPEGDEGEFPDEWNGTPVAFGYGRFWHAAWMKAADVTLFGADSWYMSLYNGSHFSNYLGFKAPVLPLTLVSINYKKPASGQAPIVPHAATIPYYVWGVGDRTVPYSIEIHTKFGSSGDFRGKIETPDTYSASRGHFYSAVMSWNSELSRAVVYGSDIATNNVSGTTGDLTSISGVGSLHDLWVNPQTGTAGQVQLIYMDSGQPAWVGTPTIIRWTGLIAFASHPFDQTPTDEANQYEFGQVRDPVSPAFFFLNRAQTIDRLKNLTDHAVLWDKFDSGVSGGTVLRDDGGLPLQCPTSMTKLGKLLYPRIGLLLTDNESLFAPAHEFAAPPLSQRHAGVVSPYTLLLPGGVNVTAFADPVQQGSYNKGYSIIRADATFAAAAIAPLRPFSDTTGSSVSLDGDAQDWTFLTTAYGTLPGDTTPTWQPYAREICLHPRAFGAPGSPTEKAAPILAAWFEVVYQPQLAAVRSLPPLSAFVRRPKRIGASFNPFAAVAAVALAAAQMWPAAAAAASSSVTLRQSGGDMIPVKYRGNVRDPEQSDQISTAMYVHGDGPQDTTGDLFTGGGTNSPASYWPNKKIIERPCDIAAHMLAHFMPSDFSARPTGTVFGSFTEPRTETPEYRFALAVTERTTLQSVFDRMSVQSESLIQRQMTDSGTTQMRFILNDRNAPAHNRYRGDGYVFRWNRIVPGSFRAYETPGDTLVTGVTLNYGYHLPSGTFASSKYCTNSITNLTTEATIYKNALIYAKDKYGATQNANYEAVDIWDHDAAERLLKYVIDNRRQPMVQVEFTTYANALDLMPGMLIRFHNEIATPDPRLDGDASPVAYPGKRAGNWANHYFTVMSVIQKQAPGEPFLVEVIAGEVYQKAT